MTTEEYRVTEDKIGSVTITRLSDGEEIFFQPGDDANTFLAEADAASFHGVAVWNAVCGQYFD